MTNYAVFKENREHLKLQQTKEERREMTKKIALFIDLRNSLGATARLIRQDLKLNEKFYQHHDYSEWYEKAPLKNKLAFEINAQYNLFEKALTLNRLQKNSLEKMVFAFLHELFTPFLADRACSLSPGSFSATG